MHLSTRSYMYICMHAYMHREVLQQRVSAQLETEAGGHPAEDCLQGCICLRDEYTLEYLYVCVCVLLVVCFLCLVVDV